MEKRRQTALTINGRFLCQPLTGVQRYAREIIASLDEILSDPQSRSSLRARIIMPPGADRDYTLASIAKEGSPFGNGALWDQLVFPLHAEGIVLSLCNQGPLLVKEQIICLHDVNTLLAPESYSRPFRLYYRAIQPLLAHRATHIVTVSHFSARMLAEHGICPPAKITIIPNGHEHVHRWNSSQSVFAFQDAHPRPYVFLLGSRARHKNIAIMFPIAAALASLGIDIVIAGAAAGMFFDGRHESLPSNVRMLGFVNDNDLAALYKNALCFAFPSLTEGFGVPALEAMALRCPVVASDVASLPEVCGAAALYANPQSSESWLRAISDLHAQPELAESMRDKGQMQAKRFSWAQSAQAYLNLVEQLSGSHKMIRGSGD